ncbi:amidohydrolase family protein [Leptolyngbya sp. 15MV]|nr:amidohydrolase family protein [Leptolyngbya sp. 15MV]
MTTLIRNADLVVAWDAAAGSHIYLPDADVAFEGGAITFVGRHYAGPAEEEISGRGLMVMPGLVNIHSHPSSEPLNKGLIDEIGSPGLYNSSLYEFMPIFRADAEAVPHCVRVALSELLLSGVTTVADLSMAHPGWLDLLAESGLRVCVAPMFKSAKWYTKNGHVVQYEWDEAAGEKAMDEALRLIERAEQHECGRLFGMVVPAQIDTCTDTLLKESFQEAGKRGVSWQIHAAQSVVEFHEITRRHGMTPIGWLDSMGLLSDRSIIGHGIFPPVAPRAVAPAATPPAPRPTSAPAPTPAPRPRATATPLALDAMPVQLSRSMMNATFAYRLTLANRGETAVENVAIGADLITAHSSVPMEQQISRSDIPLPEMGRIGSIAPGEQVEVEGELRLPLSAIRTVHQGKAQLYVPLLRVRASAPGVEASARTFVVGTLPPEGGRKLQPFRLDEMPQTYRSIGTMALD